VTKNHLDVGLVEKCKVYYKGEGGGFPQVRAVVSLVCPSCFWFILAPKVLQLCTNHFVLVFCKPVWVSKTCQIFLVPSRSSSTPLYPSKVLQAKCRNPTLAKCGGEAQHLEKVRSWSPPGLPNVQSSTTRPKTPCIEVFLVSLERSWNLDIENGLALAIRTSAAQVMGKRRAGSQTSSLTPDH
jgi:hypothetical protein